MLLYSGHYFPAPGPASDHGCWAEYTTTVSSVSSTDSASHSGKKLCCYTQGTTSQPHGPQAQPQTMVVGQSIPQQYPQSPAQTVPPTQVRNYVVILGALGLGSSALSIPHSNPQSPAQSASHSGRHLCLLYSGQTSQAQPQTMVVGQSIPQQYPQSPAQTVPPTQVRNYVVILRALLPSLSPASDHGCWAEYTTTVSSVSSTDSASHW